MIARFDIIQGTDEWHEVRYRKIGGTRSAQLLIQSDALLVELVGEMTEELDYDSVGGYESAAMIRGQELEPVALARINEAFDLDLVQCGWLQCEEIDILGYSPDGISEDLDVMCEIKCPERPKHTKTILSGTIPLDNINQCLHAFAVNHRLDRLIFASFRPESIKQLFTYELTRESEVNIGTNAKPNIVTVAKAVEMIKANAILMTQKVAEKVESLRF